MNVYPEFFPEPPASAGIGAIGILIAVLVLYLIILGFVLADYIMTSLSLQKIAKLRRIPNGWLAWIPFGCDWIIGSIVDYHDAQKGIRRKWRVALLVLDLIFWIGYIFVFVALFVSIFSLGMQMSNLNMDLLPDEALIGAILGAIVPSYVALVAVISIGVAWTFCRYICLYKVFEETRPQKALKYILISLLVPMGLPICLTCAKNYANDVKVMPNPAATTVYPPQE